MHLISLWEKETEQTVKEIKEAIFERQTKSLQSIANSPKILLAEMLHAEIFRFYLMYRRNL